MCAGQAEGDALTPPGERVGLSDVEIRTLSPGQIRAHSEAFLAVAADLEYETWTEQNFLAERPNKWMLSFALWLGGRPIGYAIISLREPGHAHLHHFIIAKPFRARGLGQQMAVEMERRLRDNDIDRLGLKVAIDNDDALRFYRRHGYTEIGREGGYLLMAKHVRESG